MVLKPLSHLARRSSKVIAHHAQSITAASSTTTSQHLDKYAHHRFVKHGGVRRESFHTTTLQQAAGLKGALPNINHDYNHDGDLDAYFVAWQKVQHGGEWSQFQFARRIGWRANSSNSDVSKNIEKQIEETLLQDVASVPVLGRARSASAIEGVPQTHLNDPRLESTEIAELANVDEAIAHEIKDIQDQSSKSQRVASTACGASCISNEARLDNTPTQAPLAQPIIPTSIVSKEPTNDGALFSESTDPTRISDYILALERDGKFVEIPSAFQTLLSCTSTPSVEVYNALLSAAIWLPRQSYQVVSKVISVYSDLLHRKIRPDLRTYTLLLEALSIRACQVLAARKRLEADEQRFRNIGGFGPLTFGSYDTEAEILAEDDSFTMALKIFPIAIKENQDIKFSSATYRVMIEACAAQGDVDAMIRIHAHMESSGVIPYGSIYPAMISAFASVGEMRNAIECYEAYKSMAVADDAGILSILDRVDDAVYSAVINGYLVCDKTLGANAFFEKLSDVTGANETQQARLSRARDTVLGRAYAEHALSLKDFDAALRHVALISMSSSLLKEEILGKVCIGAADQGSSCVALKALSQITDPSTLAKASISMIAMHLRHGDLNAARKLWSENVSKSQPSRDLIRPAAIYAIALARSGLIDEGTSELRQFFKRLQSTYQASKVHLEVSEKIDEAVEFIVRTLHDQGIVCSAHASMNLMWAMVDNGGLLPSPAEHLLSGLRPEDVTLLSTEDLKLALQIEAGVVGSGESQLDNAHVPRFAHMLETALGKHMSMDQRTADLIQRALVTLEAKHPDLIAKWNGFKYGVLTDVSALGMPSLQRLSLPAPAPAETFDPYFNTLDHRGSVLVVEELDKQGSNSSLNLSEALARFRNIRRAGRHPRYIAYAKLITASAKDGRINLIHDLIAMAERDMPLLPQYPIVRHGWASIMDAMVGACLAIGNRPLASEFHQRLRDIGCAPSANTFGLYITTLKESTKTFDEASEAVKIFQQARSEGVEPSSFLYNALIGKLGKARRIDDCLFYFAEMRARSIRPTSVTYGTIVNALCRVSDERFAQELFDEMESMPNYKPRPAPYNSMMQFFLTTKRDSSKVLEYYQRMRNRNIQPTMHTYKLLIDTYATLEPINLAAAEGILDTIHAAGQFPEAIHYSSLIHAKGCVLHDMKGARELFDRVNADSSVLPQACLYQALFESMVANHCVQETESVIAQMTSKNIEMTPYIANTLIHGWALASDVSKAQIVYDSIGKEKREPSTYEAMTRAFLSVQDRQNATKVVHEMLSRGYPAAVAGKILELLGHGASI